VELWFDHPATPGQLRVHELIAARRRELESDLQVDLFSQKRRLADAERRLASRETKSARNDRRIATNNIDRLVKKLARYHLDPDGRRGHYNARRDNLGYWRSPWGTTHALMVVTSFHGKVKQEGVNRTLHFIPRPREDMLIACLYQRQADGSYAFAAITDEPPAEVAAAGHDRMIINILPDRQRPCYEYEIAA
jgi:putative SOS response-associated peptidase YedK